MGNAYMHSRGDRVDEGPGFIYNLPGAFDRVSRPTTRYDFGRVGFGSSVTRDQAFEQAARTVMRGAYESKDGPGYRDQGDHNLTIKPGASGGEVSRRPQTARGSAAGLQISRDQFKQLQVPAAAQHPTRMCMHHHRLRTLRHFPPTLHHRCCTCLRPRVPPLRLRRQSRRSAALGQSPPRRQGSSLRVLRIIRLRILVRNGRSRPPHRPGLCRIGRHHLDRRRRDQGHPT